MGSGLEGVTWGVVLREWHGSEMGSGLEGVE